MIKRKLSVCIYEMLVNNGVNVNGRYAGCDIKKWLDGDTADRFDAQFIAFKLVESRKLVTDWPGTRDDFTALRGYLENKTRQTQAFCNLLR